METTVADIEELKFENSADLVLAIDHLPIHVCLTCCSVLIFMHPPLATLYYPTFGLIFASVF
jgi:hypothetical protein